MQDPRIKEMAAVLVNYSTRVKKNDVVLISASGISCLPLVKEIYAQCVDKGAKYVEYDFSIPEINRHFFTSAGKRSTSVLSPTQTGLHETGYCLYRDWFRRKFHGHGTGQSKKYDRLLQSSETDN